MTLLGVVQHRLGDARTERTLTAARDLLEGQPAGPELVDAHAYVAGRLTLTHRYPPAVEAAEQALALAAKLDLLEPAFALHWRGVARCSLGDAGGLEDLRRALQLALEQGRGRETAVIYGNYAGVVWAFQGPRDALDVSGAGIAFCERRGITEVALTFRGANLAHLAELGDTNNALAGAGPLADR